MCAQLSLEFDAMVAWHVEEMCMVHPTRFERVTSAFGALTDTAKSLNLQVISRG